MGEQRFKVGDWVRRVEPSDWPEQYGVVDGVYKVLQVGRYGIAVSTGAGEADATSFEPWHPRVGERVRVVDPAVVIHWNEFWTKETGVKLSLGDFVYATKFIPNYLSGKPAIEIAAKPNGSGPRWPLGKFEPLIAGTTPEQPATLKIEAGKFYKTRDGRKAKIERSHYGDTYDFVATVEGLPGNKVYKKDGKHGSRWIANNPIDDLISEWIDEPVAKPSNDNAQPKFKVGDRVEITANDNYRVNFVGSFGTIKTAPTNAAAGFRVELDDGREFPFWPSEMTVRPSSALPTTTIVALIEDGQPKPSSTPHVHASTGAAEAEAKRLAAKYKGKQFGVFTLTATHEEAAPVYDHKWQNMAALGLKIDAIKELRAVAGLDLLSAKRAVEAFEQAA